MNRIGIAGHSLGGDTGAAAMAYDSRIKAAVNIDGTLYGGLPESTVPRPFLLVESNKSDTARFARYEAGNQLIFKTFGGGYRKSRQQVFGHDGSPDQEFLKTRSS